MLRPLRASVPIPGGPSQVARLLSFLAIYFSASSVSLRLIFFSVRSVSSVLSVLILPETSVPDTIGFALTAAKVHRALRPPRAKSAPPSLQSPAHPECHHECTASARQRRLPSRRTQSPPLVQQCVTPASRLPRVRGSAHPQTCVSAKFHPVHTAGQRTLRRQQRSQPLGKHPASATPPAPQERPRDSIVLHLQQSLAQSRDHAPPD